MAKIIFFSPHSLSWVTAFPEALVAESLAKNGHEIVYITCGEFLNSACILMLNQPNLSDAGRAQICRQCSLRAGLIRKKMKFPGYSLSSVSDFEDEKKAKEVMKGVSAANFSQLVVENVSIGKVAAYEFLIKHKKMTAEFSESEWSQFYPILENAVRTFYTLKRVFNKEKPDYVISCNNLYSVHAVCSHLAKEKGVVPYFLDAGMNFSNRLLRLQIGRNSVLFYIKEVINRWPIVKGIPCNKELLSEGTEHFLEVLQGNSSFAFSAPKAELKVDVREKFGICPDQKILVATMSSYDEVFAGEFVGAWSTARKDLFKTQVDWIQALVEWIKCKPGYFLIVRVHPREFPNKRASIKSEHASMVQKLFTNFPKNVKVNWPEEKLSLYDLACEADVFLNAWSSAGQEMSLLGLPVVVYSKEALFYPADLNYLGETEGQYFDQIEQALKDGWSAERVRSTFRWFALMFGRSEIRIDDSYAGIPKPVVYKNIVSRKFAGGLRRLFPLLPERQDLKRRASKLRHAEALNRIFTNGESISFDSVNLESGSVPTMDEETEYIKCEMMRIAKAMWGGIEVVQGGQPGKLFLHFRKYLTS